MADDLPWEQEQEIASFIYQPTPAEVVATRDPVEFLWEQRIPAGKVSIFSGAGGSGKSSLLTGFAVARACGKRFLGKLTPQGATLVVSAEDTVIDYMRKVDAWRETYPDLDPVAIARNLKILPLVGWDYRLVGGRYNSVRVEIERVDRLAVACRGLTPRPDLIILETASRFGAGDENSNEAAAALIAACERLADIAQAAVLLVSHTGKGAAREQIIDAYSARGASAFVDNARSALVLGTIAPDRAKRLALTVEEARELLVLACPKANLAGRTNDIVLERVETVHGLVLRPFDGGGMSDSEAVAVGIAAAAAKHVENGRRLREVIAKLTQEGTAVTARLLREEQRAAIRWITYRDIPEIIEQAISDGWLVAAEGSKRGGKVLLPGPRTTEAVAVVAAVAMQPLDGCNRSIPPYSLSNGEAVASGCIDPPCTASQAVAGSLSLIGTQPLQPLGSTKNNNSLAQPPNQVVARTSATASSVDSNGLLPNIPAAPTNGAAENKSTNIPAREKSPNIPAKAATDLPWS